MILEMLRRKAFWIAPCACILALFLIPAVAAPEEIYKFERMWPTLQQPWYFYEPDGIAIDSKGYVYIADRLQHNILKFTLNGEFVTKWKAQPSDEDFSHSPGAVAVDPSGDIVVLDFYYGMVLRFDSNGHYLAKWGNAGSGNGQFNKPWGIAVDRQGYIYVADSGNHRVQKFSASGHFITKWGSFGTGLSQFNEPRGIGIDRRGNILVADSRNHRIQKFTEWGGFVSTWGTKGVADGSFNEPWGIAVRESGNILVTDFLNSRVQEFSENGDFFRNWGKRGIQEGEFLKPVGIALDRGGNVYVTEGDYVYYGGFNARIQKFSSEGVFLAKWESYGNEDDKFTSPSGIACDIIGNIYVTDRGNSRVQVFTPDGQFITKWGSHGQDPGQFDSPDSIAVDFKGNVFVADRGNNRVQKFTKDGVFITEWGGEGTGEGQFNDPWAISVGANGMVYVADSDNHRVQEFTSYGVFVGTWGTYGDGNGQFYHPEGIDVDINGMIYVTDSGNTRVQKFDSNKNFVTAWGTKGTEEGQFYLMRGISTDASGNVYVVEWQNNRMQKFTSDGLFITRIGTAYSMQGSEPGRFYMPYDVCIGADGRVYITDNQNRRIQVFRKVELQSNNKAIIVAGGGAYLGNDLWDATQMSANFAYRTLTYQGFTKESIHYLSSANIDLDDNGVLDDVAGDATNASLENAILNWASGADDVILYLVDHGGEGSFRMSGTETLTAEELCSWLDTLQNTITGKMIVIYDACGAGSFVSPLRASPGKQRIVIASTSPNEKAYFLSQGSISFSNYFWTHIFNGASIRDAFNLSMEAISYTSPYQHPLLDADGNGIANEATDFSLVQNSYIGNGTVIYGSAPVIVEISSPKTITDTSSALLYASGVNDSDGIARVWAVIRPPDYRQGSGASPVQDLPSIDLMPVGSERYEATYSIFTTPGTYQVAIYARDNIGNTSIPKVTQISVVNPLRRKAVIVAAGSQSDALWPAIEKNAGLAYGALKFQGYVDDDIYFMSPVTFSAGVDVMPTLSNLSSAITGWAATNTQDLVVYLIGKGGNGTYEISPTETLSAFDLKQWLDTLQETIPGKVAVIYDGPSSGSFLPLLTPPSGKQRILVSSTGSDQAAHFLRREDLSFSRFFWSRVSNGMNVRDAYLHAKRALSFVGSKQEAFLDDNGNGIGNEKSDGQVAFSFTIGFGITLGSDDPLIGSVSSPQILSGQASATIWAKDVTTTGRIAGVWAVVTTPEGTQTAGSAVTDLPSFDLIYDQATNQYEGTYYHFNTEGEYGITVYARDWEGNISLPATTTVTQGQTLDPYEDDNIPSRASVVVLNDLLPQGHTFHAEGDVDWVKFYALSGETYEIKTENLGARCDTVLTLYGGDGTTVIKSVDDDGPGEGELLTWQCGEDGIYYIMVTQYDPSIYGEDTGYDLRVYVPAAPPLVAFIKGTVTDFYSGDSMAGVRIKTDAKISALSLADGNYLMLHPAGTFNLTAEASGYEHFTDTVTITEAETINKNIAMNLIVLKGDVNHDHRVNLIDAILASRVLSCLDTSGETISLLGDVNGDGKIGMAEVLYILQTVAGMR
jgi:sugar lactone lactonase YvrE